MTITAVRNVALPVGSIGRSASGWWGMMALVLTEAALFSYLLFSDHYFAVQSGQPFMPPDLPSVRLSGPNTLVLIASSVAVWWGQRGIRHDAPRQLAIGLGIAIVLGIIFVAVQGLEWSHRPFRISSNAYGSLYYTITGFHMAHVVVGLVTLGAMLTWTLLGHFDSERHAPISIGSIRHFVDVVWLAVFFTFYVTPFLG